MGSNYFPNDTDRVKSSGGDGKIETYRWETVTQEDRISLRKLGLSWVKQHPIIYDAFLAKVYGYFDVNDQPYVSTTYYLDNSRLSAPDFERLGTASARSIKASLTFVWGSVPVIGWITHGNASMLRGRFCSGCAVIILRRWMDLLRFIPLILLMGVMIMAPANNFERLMLPLCFVGWLMLMHFAHLARRAYAQHRITKGNVILRALPAQIRGEP